MAHSPPILEIDDEQVQALDAVLSDYSGALLAEMDKIQARMHRRLDGIESAFIAKLRRITPDMAVETARGLLRGVTVITMDGATAETAAVVRAMAERRTHGGLDA